MPWFVVIERWMVMLAVQIPLPAFVLLGEVIEEVVSPIPSQAVLITAGSIAQAQHVPFVGLFVLACLGAFAKTMATMVYFLLAGALEERFVARFGKFIGVTQSQIDAMAKRLNRGPAQEFLSLFAVRCLPILPSVPVSIVCGVLKVNKKAFFFSTLAGNTIRGGLVLLTGYLGFDVLAAFANGGLSWRTFLGVGILALLLGFFGWGYWKRYARST